MANFGTLEEPQKAGTRDKKLGSNEKGVYHRYYTGLMSEAWELMTHEHDPGFSQKGSGLADRVATLLAKANIKAMSLNDLLDGYHLADTISHRRGAIREVPSGPRMFEATGIQADRFQEEIDDRMGRAAVAPEQKRRAGTDGYMEHLTRDGKILTLRSDGKEAEALRTYAVEKNNLENAWQERRKG